MKQHKRQLATPVNNDNSTTPDANQAVETVQVTTLTSPSMCLHCGIKPGVYDGYCSTPCMNSAFCLYMSRQ